MTHGYLPLERSFKDSTRQYTCVGIASHHVCRRLDYVLAIWNVCRKWLSMDTGEFNARENSDGWMFEMSWWDDRHMGQFSTDVSKQAKTVDLSQNRGWHHDAYVVSLGTEMRIRCDVAVLQTNEHAHTNGVCGWTSLDSAQVVFGWQRQTSTKVQQSYKARRKMWMGHESPIRLIVSVSRSRCCTIKEVQLWH